MFESIGVQMSDEDFEKVWSAAVMSDPNGQVTHCVFVCVSTCSANASVPTIIPCVGVCGVIQSCPRAHTSRTPVTVTHVAADDGLYLILSFNTRTQSPDNGVLISGANSAQLVSGLHACTDRQTDAQTHAHKTVFLRTST